MTRSAGDVLKQDRVNHEFLNPPSKGSSMDDIDSDARPAGLGKPLQLLLRSRVRSFYKEYQWALIGGL
jgi:hypothetical protein